MIFSPHQQQNTLHPHPEPVPGPCARAIQLGHWKCATLAAAERRATRPNRLPVRGRRLWGDAHMRCLNCRMVMAANDTHCLSCGMQLTVPERGWVHAYTYGSGPVAAPPAGAARLKKRLVAVALLLLGAGSLFGAAALIVDRQREADATPPKTWTAAELVRVEDPAKVSDKWVVYDAPRVIETEVGIISGRKHKTRTRFLLVPVEDRWLVVEVGPGFSGKRIEGRMFEMDSPMYLDALGRIRASFPEQSKRLL